MAHFSSGGGDLPYLIRFSVLYMFNTYTNNEIAYNVKRPMRDHMLDPMTPELGRMLSFYLCSSQLTFPGVYLSICLLTANTTQPGQPSVTRPLLLSYYITLLLPFPSLPMLWYRWQNPVQVQQLENLVVQCTLLQPTMVYLNGGNSERVRTYD